MNYILYLHRLVCFLVHLLVRVFSCDPQFHPGGDKGAKSLTCPMKLGGNEYDVSDYCDELSYPNCFTTSFLTLNHSRPIFNFILHYLLLTADMKGSSSLGSCTHGSSTGMGHRLCGREICGWGKIGVWTPTSSSDIYGIIQTKAVLGFSALRNLWWCQPILQLFHISGAGWQC